METEYYWDEFNELTYNNRLGIYKKEIELQFIRKFLHLKSCIILDIGGGSGRMALPLQQCGMDVTIVDINKNGVDLALQRGLKAEWTDFMDYQSHKKYDIILSIELLDYIGEKQVFFKKCKNLLNSEGILIFTIPNIRSWRYMLRSLKKIKTNYFHLSLNSYKRLLCSNDFEIVATKGFLWVPLKTNSNSLLVYVFKFLERIFGLNHFISQSPWLIIACRKKSSIKK